MRTTIPLLLFCVTLFGGVKPTSAGQQDDKSFEKLTVIVSTAKASFIELEPVSLIVRVENRTGHDVVGPPNVFAPTTLQVWVARPNEDFVPYRPVGASWGSLPKGSKNLPHNWTGESTTAVFHKSIVPGKEPLRLFDVAGKYKCKVQLSFLNSEVFSKEIEIHIIEPSLAADVGAMKCLRDSDLDRFLSDQNASNEVDPIFMEKLEDVLKSFPGSTYEKYIYFGLGSLYFAHSTPGGQRKDFDEPGLRKAIALCGKVASLKDYPSAIDAAYYAGRACYYIKDTKNARVYLNAVLASGCERHTEKCRKLLESVDTLERAGLSK